MKEAIKIIGTIAVILLTAAGAGAFIVNKLAQRRS